MAEAEPTLPGDAPDARIDGLPDAPPAGPPRPPAPPLWVPLPPPPPDAGILALRPGAGHASLPSYAPAPQPAIAPVVSEAVLAIPLGTRELVRQALDLLTRRDAGLRAASFYIGLMLLVTVGPAVVLFGIGLTIGAWPGLLEPAGPTDGSEALALWTVLAMLPALLGYLAASVEARSMATAVIGGRVEGRPLRLRESIAIARRRFWSILVAQLLVAIIASLAGGAAQVLVQALIGPVDAVLFGVTLVISVLVSAPFVYVAAGIILGEVGALDAIARSVRLVLLRKRLAVVVTLFSVLGQFIVLFGLSIGLDTVARVLTGTGLVEDFPRPLVVPVAAALVFAIGTLVFLVEAIAAAPAVHAFAALTHYTHGLELGREQPIGDRGPLSPWLTPGLAICGLVALAALVLGVLALPG
jgi:hypothetical protein